MIKDKEEQHEIFAQYLRDLREFATAEKTEHTDRGALEKLLKAFAAQAHGKPKVQHEPKRDKTKGAPDFKVIKDGMILGYVENKTIGENLTKVLKSDQIAKYKTLSPNIVLTDYLEFAWISKDGINRETLCHDTDLENRKFKLNPERIAAVAALLAGFFSTAPEGIGTSKPLAEALAARSRLLRDYLGEELVRQEREHQEGRLFGLYKTFRDQVFHELTLKEFADAFAQMLAYGLFLARLNADDKVIITLSNARDHIPGSFQLIHELVEFLTELNKTEYQEIRWVVEEVLSIVNGLDLPAIHEDLSFRQRRAISRKVRAGDEEEHRLFERDPFIYFYEDYLKAYDKETRKARGVYYTPPPVVNFIVRAIDDILKDSFGIKEGLADNNRVTVLDFACGTGTFLLEVFQQIFENIGGADKAIAKKVVSDHILRNIYGFEYLIAPYTIAHLKLSQYLRDKGHSLKGSERLKVYLTNTLEPIQPQANLLLPAITEEAKEAQEVKKKPILVITGNPPYSGNSKNKGEWISSAIDGYKFTITQDAEGREAKKPLGERNPKWLNDDYVKFIRFAQLKMDEVEEGIVGIITNHSWLDNPTFRGMRQSLMRSFNQIYVLDLHGSTKPKEPAPPGVANENVFDIQKGVSITLFVKRKDLEQGVWFAEAWGTRLKKYEYSAEAKIRKIDWKRLSLIEPYYMFRPIDWTEWKSYSEGWLIADSLSADDDKRQIFNINVLGFQTHRDDFAVAYEEKVIRQRIRDLRNKDLTDQKIADKDFPPAANESSQKRNERLKSVATLRSNVETIVDWERPIITCAYRPFDTRWCYFDGGIMDRPRKELLDHVAWRENLELLVPRQIGTEKWRHSLVADCPPNDCLVSDASSEANYVFPLHLFSKSGKTENLSSEFRNFLDVRFGNHYSPEEILGYIYGVLFAPEYRSRYEEFLRFDFPRVPFPKKASDFEQLSNLGWELVQAHLLKDYPDAGLAKFDGNGDESVEAVRYSEVEKAIWINKTQCFKPVPEDVWNFHIGGYQVLEKYLKSRKGRQLSLDEIKHVGKVADSLAFTITQMAKIDKAYKKAFPDRG